MSYKIEKIQINISSVFMARARCKECAGLPNFYYNIPLPYLAEDPSTYYADMYLFRKIFKKVWDLIKSDWYLNSDPKHFHSIHDFSTSIEGKSFNVKLKKNRGVANGFQNNIIEVLSCACGSTVWAFNQKSTKNKLEIFNRKGKYNYPKTFTF